MILPAVNELTFVFAVALALFDAFLGAHPKITRAERAIGKFLLRKRKYTAWEAYVNAARAAVKKVQRDREQKRLNEVERASQSVDPDLSDLLLYGTLGLGIIVLAVLWLFCAHNAWIASSAVASLGLLMLSALTAVPRRIYWLKFRARRGTLHFRPTLETLALHSPGPRPLQTLQVTLRSLAGVLPLSLLGVPTVILFLAVAAGFLLLSTLLLLVAHLALFAYFVFFYPSAWLTQVSARRFPGLRSSPIAILSFWLTMVGASLHYWRWTSIVWRLHG